MAKQLPVVNQTSRSVVSDQICTAMCCVSVRLPVFPTAQLIAVALAAMLYQLDSVRRVCRQRMACFSVFLALPSATLRTMATASCQVSARVGL
jgi:hypothetical protein